MTTTIFAHIYEEDHITTSRDEEHNICWLQMGGDLRLSINSSKKRDEIIKQLTLMEFDNEDD